MDALVLDDVLSHLFSLSTHEARVTAIENAIAANPQTLEAVLNAAARWVGSDPELAHQWLNIVASIARERHQPAQAARAAYVLAQVHAARGELDVALQLIASANSQYVSAGLTLDALRTGIGRIHVLKELGQYSEALRVANDVLQTIDIDTPPAVDQDTDASARLLIAALAHQNRGVCFEQMGRYAEALVAYQAAEDRFRTLDAEDHIGDIINNRGVILLHLGRTAEALKAFEAADTMFSPSDDIVKRALMRVNMGYAHTQQGDDVKGLAAFEQATRTLTAVHADAEAQIAMLDMAEAYLSLNLHAEACTAYRDVLDLTERTEMKHEQARANWGLGIALAALGQPEQAAGAFEQAAALFEAAGNVPMLCNVFLQQSVLSEGQAHFDQALAQIRRVIELASQSDWPLQRAEAQLRLAELMPHADLEAPLVLVEAQRLVTSLDLPRLHVRLHSLLGRAAFAQGRLEEAEKHFETAIEQIEAHRAKLDRAHLRAMFAQDKHAVYEDQVRVMLARGAEPKQIFAWVERAKSRALLDMLVGTHAGTNADDECNANSAAHLKQRTFIATLQARLSELYTKLMLGPSAFATATGSDDFVRLQIEAIEVERQISYAQVRAASLSPIQADPIAAPLDPDEIQARLPNDVTVLSYYICHDEVIAFVTSHQSLQLVRQVTTVAVVRPLLEQLRAEWQRFQLGDAFVHKHMAQLESSVKEPLHALHRALLDALEPALPYTNPAHLRKWVIVPHGLLHHVPFQALFDGAVYVIENHEVSYAPSCTAYALSQTRHLPAMSRSAVFGNDDASVSIPNVLTEARAVAQTLAGSALYLNEAATLAAFHKHAPGCEWLHLACHGLFRADNPMFSALKLHDGWLKAIDVLGLDLTGACVALSACDSGRNEVLGGDELMGPARAFLGAGAASLLVSQWLVRDESTAMLMTAWYAHMAHGLGRCAALRAAQLQTRTAFSHPYYWAPFVLIGQRE